MVPMAHLELAHMWEGRRDMKGRGEEKEGETCGEKREKKRGFIEKPAAGLRPLGFGS